MGRWTRGAVPALIWLLAGARAGAATPEERVRQIQGNKASQAVAVAAGRKVASFCSNCHGEDGHGRQPEVPNLAGQPPTYLMEQLRRFGSGQRRNEFMEGLARVLSDDDRVNVVTYFSAQPPRASSAGGGAAEAAGREVYSRQCQGCHGETPYGRELLPRLAGQQKDYLRRAMPRHRDRADGHPDKKAMLEVVTRLSEPDLRNVAAYLSALN